MEGIEFVKIHTSRDGNQQHLRTCISVTKETQKRVKEIAEISGNSMMDTAEMLMRFALEHVVWVDEK